MTTYTEQGLVKQDPGENDLIWGNVLESGLIDILDDLVAGREDVDMTSGNVTLTDLEGVTSQARHMILRATGTPAVAVTIFVPLKQKLYVIDNECGQSLTVKTSTGIGVVIEDGEVLLVVVDKSRNQVFKMQLHNQNVVELAQDPMTSIPSTVLTSVSDPLPTFYYALEGSNLQAGLTPFSFQLTAGIPPASFVVRPVSGVFPVGTQPLVAHYVPVLVGATVRHCSMTLTENSISFIRRDSLTFPVTTTIVVPTTLNLSWIAAPI